MHQGCNLAETTLLTSANACSFSSITGGAATLNTYATAQTVLYIMVEITQGS